jgi:hypothetical protein
MQHHDWESVDLECANQDPRKGTKKSVVCEAWARSLIFLPSQGTP